MKDDKIVTDNSKVNVELLERYNEAVEALEELVQIKDWKDKYGKDERYLRCQPVAWNQAKEVLNKHKEG